MDLAQLRALAAHADPLLSRLAREALHAMERVQVRRAVLSGAPSHVVDAEGGVQRRLGPDPRVPGAYEPREVRDA